jgi:tetratricopeptide (TPR) repeat protein
MEYVAHTAYAEFLLQQKLVPEAIDHFYTAALLHPSCLECWVYLLQYYTEKNENEKAYQIAKEAIEAVPNHPVLLFYSGMLALMNDQKEDALVQLLEMIKFTDYNEPNYAEMNAAAHAMLVDLYLIYKKDYPKALEQCDLALKLNPSNHVVMNNCAYTLALQNEQLERAEKLSAQSLEAEPMNVSYLDTYAYILFKQKRYETALFFIEKAMEYTKDGEKNAVVYERYGDILYFLGQQTKALEMWQKALELTQDATDTIKQKVNTKKYVE